MNLRPQITPRRRALLKTPIRDLGLRLEGSPLEPLLGRLERELRRKLERFRPRYYLTDEWGCPSGQPVIGIPFYLADRELSRIEKATNDLETPREILMYLRHEAGHAFNYAYRLYLRPEWRATFGPYRRRYRDDYRPVPFSREYVRHLPGWYAQKHPDEDFAETFAVWLQPRSNWRRRYRGWPALKKLDYVDELLNEVAGTRPRNRMRKKIETLSEIRITLREHYDRKREKYAFEWPAYLDNDLRRIFSSEPRHRDRETAASFLRRVAPEIQQLVSEGTGVHGYAIDHVLELMIERAAQLKLRAIGSREHLKRHLMIMLTVQTMNVVHSGYYRIAL